MASTSTSSPATSTASTSAITTTVTELPESRVRVQVQVSPEEVESRIERKARQLGRELKLPGFRRGKVPAPLVLQKVGREAVLEEAVRDSLGGWYADAITASGIVPVGDPQRDLGELPTQGQALQFSIEIGVLPTAELGEYKGLEVGRAEPQVEGQRGGEEGGGARRAAGGGAGPPDDSSHREPFAGGEGRDQLVELGSGSLIPGFEEGLLGARAGDQREVKLSFPADYGHEQLAGAPASFAVTVKDVKRKDLPELNEDFAIDVGF